MGRKSSYSIEEKIQIINEYQRGENSFTDIHARYGLAFTTLRLWENIYEKEGRIGFEVKQTNAGYSKELKESAIHDYLNGVGSYRELCRKYRIPSITTLDNWVKKYNGYEKLKDYDPKGAVYMIPKRKTSLEERIEIVKYCLDHDSSYKHTAEYFKVAYSQVYQWVKKYEMFGEDGLVDRRGIHKIPEELSELDRLKRENEQLRRQLELKERETILLKKVKEFERRRYFPKSNKNHNI
jgi:transposase-like protein